MSGNASKEMRHALKERGDDFYETPLEAVRALIAIEVGNMPTGLWEPACGAGAIVTPLRAAGYIVHASDLVARGCPDSESRVDFLLPVGVPVHAHGIVTNPPFKLATQFVEKAVGLVPYVAILARLSFLEGSKRKTWFEASSLSRVHISSKRLPMMHRDGWKGDRTSSSIAFAWFIWDKRTRQEHPEIHWFDWREYQ
jgi:hypothetical protein